MVPQSSSGWGPTQPRCSCCNCNHGSWRGRLALYYGKHPALTSQGSDVFPFPSPSTSHAQMLCSSLFYSSQHRFLSCCCVMPIMLQRQWLPWDFLFVWFIFFFFHEFYDGFFLLNALNSSGAFIWKEIRGMCWPYVSIPVQPPPTAWMKKRIWRKWNHSRTQNLTPSLWSGN